MSLSLYQISIPLMLRQLRALSAILDKAIAHASEQKFEPAALLQARLYPDMYDFIRQVQTVTDMAKGGAARLANVEVPKMDDTEVSFDDLKARLAKTIAFLESLKPAQIDGGEDVEVQIPVGRETRTMKALAYWQGFVLPNFYFHAAMAYGLLRHNGVPVGKRDFLGLVQ
jgi:uncharacterized protein